MKLNYQSASLYIHADVERKIDSTVIEALDCLHRESDSMLDLLVVFESMKFQVLELAQIRLSAQFVMTRRSSFYEKDLYALEAELLLSQEISVQYRSALLLLLAMTYYGLHDLPRAQKLAERARRDAVQCAEEDGLGFNDVLLAFCSAGLHQWQIAADRCVLALSEIAYHENKSTLAQVWHLYGQVLQQLGHGEEAIAALVMSQNLYGEQRNAESRVHVLISLASLFKANGDWHGMVYYLKQALVVCVNNAYTDEELQVLGMLREAFSNLGKNTEADGCSHRMRHLQATAL